uniref:Uncharacterized protein n=1 Tax=Rhizophora mucronata TaxID=61149 RepID=A0A2P2NV85_RHIMU
MLRLLILVDLNLFNFCIYNVFRSLSIQGLQYYINHSLYSTHFKLI